MKLESRDIRDGKPIDPKFAFGRPDPDDHMTFSENLSPHLAWSEAPGATKSFVVLCVDPDVPSVADDVNQEDRVVPAVLKRVDFYHWALIDVPPTVDALETGACSDGVTPRGKTNPPGPDGSRQGLNNFTQFLAGDDDMAGNYYGYDGPCPPWNDELLHHYRFTVYALDIDRLPVKDDFDGGAVLEAMQGHVLAQASIMGTYTLNPEV